MQFCNWSISLVLCVRDLFMMQWTQATQVRNKVRMSLIFVDICGNSTENEAENCLPIDLH